ncbi:helix-turn-helix transcriptional regulator [Burkholderia gladioli]|uniref:helix-turn-helix transcriptional regulator n=1 Tax=Burkholderia gladioli TaxID=28095 RepID=UPI0016402B86|nr:AlpA family phage regulatory protein [Burkholderia gladioli]
MASMQSLPVEVAAVFGTSASFSAKTDNVVGCKPPIDRVLRLAEVLEIVPIGRTKLLQMVKEGAFPAPLRLTTRIRGWRLSAIEKFLASVEGE